MIITNLEQWIKSLMLYLKEFNNKYKKMTKMKDFDIGNLFKSGQWFAIELEIAEERRDDVQKIAPFTSWYRESIAIYEINSWHERPESDREAFMEAFDFLKDNYKDQFPMGRNWYTSWGVHFHLFDFDEIKTDKHKEMEKALLNLPLFNKVVDGKYYWRRNGRHQFFACSSITYDTKWYAFCSNPCGSFEFRCNNVIDERILWYYQAVMLMHNNDIIKKIKPLSKNFINYNMKWDDFTIEEGTTWGDYSIDDLSWYNPNKEDIARIKYNLSLALNILRENGLTVSAEKLEEYCLEKNII